MRDNMSEKTEMSVGFSMLYRMAWFVLSMVGVISGVFVGVSVTIDRTLKEVVIPSWSITWAIIVIGLFVPLVVAGRKRKMYELEEVRE